jgi:hypothetical protein
VRVIPGDDLESREHLRIEERELEAGARNEPLDVDV